MPDPRPTHVCLVSAQATPNLTPALDPALAPGRVILLVSPDMTRQAERLATVLGRRGIRCETWPIADPWDLEQVQQRVMELLERETASATASALVLNATGGTKPMSIGALDAFRAWNLPIFYVHPERDRLIWLHPAGRAPVELANRVGLADFLAAHGATLISRTDDAVPAARQDLTDWLVRHTAGLARPLATLNWLASRAEGGLVSPPLEPAQRADPALADLLDRLAAAGLLTLRADRLHFADEPARFYVNGGWLEEHVHACLRALRRATTGLHDLARAVTITIATDRGEEVPNELDVLCLADNRLAIIECKTRQWGKAHPANGGGPGNEALYRLDTLGDLLGGLKAQAMLVSYTDLPARIRRRAATLRVAVCAGARLTELPTVLRDWLRLAPRAT